MISNYKIIASELAILEKQVTATVNLLDEGATIPFISRYRKEVTGSLDEVQVAAIRDRVMQLRELDKRRDAILKSLAEMGKLTTELEKKIVSATNMTMLEDIYLPYRPKRKTRATTAREKGLQPLADKLFLQANFDLNAEVLKFINPEKEVKDQADALSGARDILAEQIMEMPQIRSALRNFYLTKANYQSKLVKGKEQEAQKYKDYFDWAEPIKSAPSHRVLALRRAEKEGMILLSVEVPESDAISLIHHQVIISRTDAAEQVKLAIADGYKRLLKPSIESEIRLLTKKKADDEAIRVFAENMRQLLLAAPLGQKQILAIDPGFRTGCKVVCLDRQGSLVENTTIFPHTGNAHVAEAEKIIRHLIEKYKIDALAIGNGTAGRETETFIKSLNLAGVMVVMVNESGASVYSASAVAREEFPDKDITVRGAVSIGRRLMDPLAELVKIDPKSIGVGQYQHDVDQSKLQTSLDDTVISCVNAIGVEINTASKQILSYISGLSLALAQNIIDYRSKNGAFKGRSELKKIPRLGEKAFEQAAGFLRIRGAKNPLDSSGVHPERYDLVKKMAADLGCKVDDLINDAQLRNKVNLQLYVTENVGLPTLTDIINELAKPGLDPRSQFEAFSFTPGVNAISDLIVGMKLTGIITNITAFGAFADVGVHQDGLIHLSQMANRYIKDPNEIVKVGQHVQVIVKEVDIVRKRIALSMKTETTEETNKSGLNKQNNNKTSIKEPAKVDFADKLASLKNKFG